MSETTIPEPDALSIALVRLFKGPVYSDQHEVIWHDVVTLQAQIADYVAILGLQVVVDENEGYAFLRSLPESTEGDDFPRLVARHSLPFHVSLLLALLRKQLAEHDRKGAERLVLDRQQIASLLTVFLPDSSDEAKTAKLVDTQINKVVDLGFLRKMRGSDDQFEVRRILKAFVDAMFLDDFAVRLDTYIAEITQPIDES